MKTTFLKWLVVVGGAGLATAVIAPRVARSADHLDAPATKIDHPADINDVYTFLDGTNVAFVMTTFPAAPAGTKFSDAVQYVFHTASGAALLTGTTQDYNIICTFDAAQKIQCWGGTDEYVTGDASAAAGVASADGKMKVFAGMRADPFFFNLDGFKDATKFVATNAPALVDAGIFNGAGCPQLPVGTAAVVGGKLAGNPDAAAAGIPDDFFKKLNGMAIVVSIDKSLINKGGPVTSVWASTHKKP